jgi:hypothetical protein
MSEDSELNERELQILTFIFREVYNGAIDDAANLLNSLDLPKEELAAAIRKLKK